jgi:hypothetical protein
MPSILRTLFLALVLVAPQSHAGMVATEAARADVTMGAERARVKALLERPEVAKQLEKFGLPPQAAASRVDAMTDAEVQQLAGRIDALPAGGDIANQTLLLLIILIIVLILVL